MLDTGKKKRLTEQVWNIVAFVSDLADKNCYF